MFIHLNNLDLDVYIFFFHFSIDRNKDMDSIMSSLQTLICFCKMISLGCIKELGFLFVFPKIRIIPSGPFNQMGI